MNSNLYCTIALVAALSVPGVAADDDSGNAPADDVKAPPVIAYVGVIATDVPAPLAQHLELKEGFGLNVEHIVSESPAAAAGLKRHDILTKLDDQRLTTPQHFAILVRSYTPGDEASVTLLRKGVEETLQITFGEQPEMIRRALENREKMRERLSNGYPGNSGLLESDVTGSFFGSSSVIKIDNEFGEVTITESEGRCIIEVTDDKGETIYKGPYDEKKGTEGLPEEAQEFLKKMKLDDLKKLLPDRPLMMPPIEVVPPQSPESPDAKEEKEVL